MNTGNEMLLKIELELKFTEVLAEEQKAIYSG